jgi:hypothetical protein
VDLSLSPELTRSKMVSVDFGTNTPKANVKYFFDYDLELKESKTVGVYFNVNGSLMIYKFQNKITLNYVDATFYAYVNLVDKDNNTVVQDMPLNAFNRNLFSVGSFQNIGMTRGFLFPKFNTEIDWAKSYIIFYQSPGTLSGQIVPLTVYYKRKIK